MPFGLHTKIRIYGIDMYCAKGPHDVRNATATRRIRENHIYVPSSFLHPPITNTSYTLLSNTFSSIQTVLHIFPLHPLPRTSAFISLQNPPKISTTHNKPPSTINASHNILPPPPPPPHHPAPHLSNRNPRLRPRHQTRRRLL